MSTPYAFVHYMHAQTKVEAATKAREYAGAKLELERIKMRMAEILSQHEPLNGLVVGNLDDPKAMRAAMYEAVFYVVNGRFQEKVKKDE